MKKCIKIILTIVILFLIGCKVEVKKDIFPKRQSKRSLPKAIQKKSSLNLNKESDFDNVSIIGHRGDMTLPVFNSLESFKLAYKLGASGIEFDVRFTKDDINIVMHTAYLSETTECDGWVRKMTLEQLKECRLKNGEPIRTLEEMLLIIKDWYTLSFLEIKTEDEWAIRQTKDVVDILLKYNLQQRFVVISYNVKALLYLSTRFKEGIQAGWDSLDDSGLVYAAKYNFKYALMAERYVDFKNMQYAAEHNIKIIPYRVFSVSEFERLYELGVRSFIVNNNKLFIDYISSE